MIVVTGESLNKVVTRSKYGRPILKALKLLRVSWQRVHKFVSINENIYGNSSEGGIAVVDQRERYD